MVPEGLSRERLDHYETRLIEFVRKLKPAIGNVSLRTALMAEGWYEELWATKSRSAFASR